ncbi:Non-specific serine/threonine protein kinase [Bertholletia excelsa]
MTLPHMSMGVRIRNTFGIKLSCLAVLILALEIQGCLSLNSEGLTLLKFREKVIGDPYGVFENWNSNDNDPCMWPGVRCIDGKVQILDLKGLSLKGELASELGELNNLKSLVLCNNHFFGPIPKEIGELTMLEILDLRNNSLTGTVPAEIGGLQLLQCLLLSNNKFEGEFPPELGKLNSLSDLQFDEYLTTTESTDLGCLNRKLGHCVQEPPPLSWLSQVQIPQEKYVRNNWLLLSCPMAWKNCVDETHIVQFVSNIDNIVRRRLLEQSSNLAADPASDGSPSGQIISLLATLSSGSFPAVPSGEKGKLPSPIAPPPAAQPQQNNADLIPEGQTSGSFVNPSSGRNSGIPWRIVVAVSSGVLLLIIILLIFLACWRRAARNIGPWKTGLSGQLQKAFVTGVPKLNRSELEAACEDFSNIIDTIDGGMMYKGTLSSGVEIAVSSVLVSSATDWSKVAELAYRKKIETLSRVNHKNFVNLIGYCEEEEPFTRMMVFEYAPNGTLSEHLHVKDVEHLDWTVRMRIIMGTAFCLQYMHDLNPPVAHSNLNSNLIFLTDDYAAKIAEVGFRPEVYREKISGENEVESSELLPCSDSQTNVYSFGLLMLEIISGKLPNSEKDGPLLNWAAEYLYDEQNLSKIVDPTLKSFKDNELEIICKLIQDCVQEDAKKRPTMEQVSARLKDIIGISPDQAIPRLSPLWWAELEILSAEAA